MTTDDRIAAAQRQLAEVEAVTLQGLAAARAALVVVEEENRELRRQALERQIVYYTERQFADLLQVSESTIERLRLAGKLKHDRVGIQIRYRPEHFAQFAEQQTANSKQQTVGGRCGLRSVS